MRLTRLEHYEPLIGRAGVARIRKKARALSGVRVVHVNSTCDGGGVAEILSSLTPLINSLGMATQWRIIRGTAGFFDFTRTMHDALQGRRVALARMNTRVYERVVRENALRHRLQLERSLVVVHDPQPAEVLRQMFAQYRIDAITNGVHATTWTSPPFQALFDRHIPGWREENFTLRYALSIPPRELWDAHDSAKRQLIDHVKRTTNVGYTALDMSGTAHENLFLLMSLYSGPGIEVERHEARNASTQSQPPSRRPAATGLQAPAEISGARVAVLGPGAA